MIDPTTIGLAHVVAFWCGISFGFHLNNAARVAFFNREHLEEKAHSFNVSVNKKILALPTLLIFCRRLDQKLYLGQSDQIESSRNTIVKSREQIHQFIEKQDLQGGGSLGCQFQEVMIFTIFPVCVYS